MNFNRRMQEMRCTTCGHYQCEHKSNLNRGASEVVLGENVGHALANVQPYPKVDVDQEQPAKKTDDNTAPRIRIAVDQEYCSLCENPIAPKDAAFCGACGIRLSNRAIVPPAKMKDMSKIETPQSQIHIPQDTDMEKCCYCEASVMVKYMDAHFKTHISSFMKPSASTSTTTTKPSTTIATVQKPVIETKPEIQKPREETKIKSLEHYKYRQIESVSAHSSMSKDGRFSDFTVVVWLKDKPWSYGGHYMGHNHHYTSKDFERLIISTSFDLVDEYYSLSVRMVKRTTYASTDSESFAIPERLLFDQADLLGEIRRALLYCAIPPKALYKRFLKLMKTTDIQITYEKGRAVEAQTNNTSRLFEELAKKQEESKSDYNHGYDYCG